MTTASKTTSSARKSTWFNEARYGLFIHFGPYSDLGRHEWAMCYERIPVGDYKAALTDQFGSKVDVDGWCSIAAAAGMRYACLTARHHDGFCLYNTATTAFNSVELLNRDLIEEFVAACRRHHLRVGIYYSVADWGNAGFLKGPKSTKAWAQFVEMVHHQLLELMAPYGKIDYLFYDGCPPPETWRCAQINARIRALQPEILISSRCGLNEDVASAEGHTMADPGHLWESCITTNKSWGYNYGDQDWKSPREIAMLLMTCAHNGGNLLLNVGPDGRGKIPRPALSLLRQVGAWIKENAPAIYGTAPHPFNYADQKLSTSTGNTAFVPLHYYHGPNTVVAGIGNTVQKVSLLVGHQQISFEQRGNRLFLKGLPKASPDPLLPIVKLELKGKPKGIPSPYLGNSRFH